MKALAKSIYRNLPLKRQVFHALRPFGVPERVYRHLHFTGPFTVSLEGGSFEMWSYGDQVENELFWAGFAGAWERTSLEVWRRLAACATGAILDVGANTGIYALAARAVNPTSTITAFEPLRRVADRIRKNVQLNQFSIAIDARAVSDKTGTVMIHDGDGDNVYSASIEQAFPGCDRSYEVPTIALDDEPSTPVSLIKIDVEMHEPAAVRGMLGTLRRYRPAILVEVLTAEVGRQLDDLLPGLGYRTFQINEGVGLIETGSVAPLGGRTWNNLLCTPEQFEQAGLSQLLA